jgi:hypothetical protein
VTSDGGPHLALPNELSASWKGVDPHKADPVDPTTDYGRACTATEKKRMTLLPVGGGEAIVLQNPPMSAWGRSPEGWVDLYYLETVGMDAAITRAVENTPTQRMRDTGRLIQLKEPGMTLLFAGDRPGDAVYGEEPIPLPAGAYRILEGEYRKGRELTFIYRLKPVPNGKADSPEVRENRLDRQQRDGGIPLR